MILYLYNIPSVFMALIIVGGTVFCAFFGYAIATRFIHIEVDEERRSLAVTMVSIITTIQSLLVAFAAVSVWSTFNDADRIVSAEAISASELAHDLAAFESPVANATGSALRNYLEQVIQVEWQIMQRELRPDSEAERRFNTMLDSAKRITPATSRQTVLLGEILARVHEMVMYRQQRLLALSVSMPATLWAVILIVTALSFMLLYVLPPTPFHIGLIGTWAATLGLTFFFILAVDRPFAGEISVSADAYRRAIDSLIQSKVWPILQVQ